MTTDVLDDDDTTDDVLSIGGDDDPDASTEGMDRGDLIDAEINPDTLKAIAGDPAADEAPVDTKPAAPAADASTTKPDEQFVPRARLNEVLEQRRAAEEAAQRAAAENEALKAALAAAGGKPATTEPASGHVPTSTEPAAFDFDAKEGEYQDAILEGDTQKAKAIRAEIRAAERQEAVREFEYRQSVSVEQARVASVRDAAVGKYPFLHAETGNAEAKSEVIEWRDFYLSKGITFSQALQKAVDKVGPAWAAKLGQDGKPDGGNDSAQQQDPRTAAALKRNVDAANAQPPITTGAGDRATGGRINVEKLSEEEFDALPDAEKRRMRGD